MTAPESAEITPDMTRRLLESDTSSSESPPSAIKAVSGSTQPKSSSFQTPSYINDPLVTDQYKYEFIDYTQSAFYERFGPIVFTMFFFQFLFQFTVSLYHLRRKNEYYDEEDEDMYTPPVPQPQTNDLLDNSPTKKQILSSEDSSKKNRKPSKIATAAELEMLEQQRVNKSIMQKRMMDRTVRLSLFFGVCLTAGAIALFIWNEYDAFMFDVVRWGMATCFGPILVLVSEWYQRRQMDIAKKEERLLLDNMPVESEEEILGDARRRRGGYKNCFVSF